MRIARACRDPHVQAVAAFAAYAVVSVLFFGLPILGHPSRSYVGGATGNPHDPSAFMWYLVWWPFALAHGLNPFLPKVVWAPSGFNLAWATGIPGASLLAAPITMTAGPVVAYNVLCLLAPPLAAWSAFLLCRHITRAVWPAMLGGYLFGFSTYELGHMLGHLNLVLTFLIPGCVYLVCLRLDETMSPRAFTTLLALALVMQFSFSTEIFATMTLLGAIAMGMAYWVLPAERRRLRAAGLHIVCAYALAAVALSPYLYYVFAQGFPRTPLFPPERYAAPLHTFLFPTPVTYVGGHLYQALTGVRPQHLDERTAYLGAPLLAIIGLFGVRRWRVPAGKFLLLVFGLICVASLGPDLSVGGLRLPMPWALITGLPVINHALPARVTVYAFLVAALIAALWTRAAETPRWAKWTLVPLTLLCLLPNLGLASMTSDLDTPPLFTRGLYKRYLAPGENILIFPYGPIGNSMLWQAQTGMYFRMAEGYLGPIIPPEFKRWPIVRGFYAREFTSADRRRLISFLRAHDVRTVIVVGGTAGRWSRVFAALGTLPTRAGGVMLYPVPTGVSDAPRRAVAPLGKGPAVTARGTAGLSKRGRRRAR